MTHKRLSTLARLLFMVSLLGALSAPHQPLYATPRPTVAAQPPHELADQRLAVRAARLALARRLAAVSQLQGGEGNGDLSLLLAREAVLSTWFVDGEINTAPAILPEAESALVTAINHAKATAKDDVRLLRRFKTSEQWVWEARFSADGRTLATASDDDTASLWDVRTGRETLRVEAPGDQIFGVALSPDGQTLVTVANRGVVRLWNTATGQPIGQWAGHKSYVESALFSPDGRWLATADGDYNIFLWEMSTGELRHRFTGDFNLLAFSHASTWLATVAVDAHNIQLWDLQTGVLIRTLIGHRAPVALLQIAENDRSLDSIDRSGANWLVWNLQQSSPVQERTLATANSKGEQFLVGKGPVIASSTLGDDRVTLQNLSTGKLIAHIDTEHGVGHVEDFSPDGREFVTIGSDGSVALWLTDPVDQTVDTMLDMAEGLIKRQPATFSTAERQAYGLDEQSARFAVAPSVAQADMEARFVRSLVVAPTTPETRFALTNDGRIWRANPSQADDSADWSLVHVVDPTLTPLTLGIDYQPPHTLYLGTAQGIYRSADGGESFTLVNTLPAAALSVLPGVAHELWAGATILWRSQDGGHSWGQASHEMNTAQTLASPLIIVPPNNNPFFVVGLSEDGEKVLWRGNGNGFWKAVPTPAGWDQQAVEQIGLAWDNGNRTLFAGDGGGRLYQSTNALDSDERALAWSIAAEFGAESQVIALAVGQGPSLYLTVKRPAGNLFVQGVRRGQAWQWQPVHLAEKPRAIAPIATPTVPDQKLILNTGYQLWLADAAKGMVTQVVTATDEILQVHLSPDSSHVAYVVDTQPGERLRGLALHLLDLQSQEEQTISPLQPTTPLRPLSEGERANAEHATRAILEQTRGGIAWSPSGKQLAFVSGHEGSWAQLYVYDLPQGTLTQLTDAASHAYQLVWSPDERWLFHTGALSFNGSEPRQTPVGVWVSRPDGSEQRLLYPVGADSSGETLVAWIDNDTILVHSATMHCGNFTLRTVTIPTGEATVITPHAFSSIAYDAASGAALLHVEANLRCNPATFQGTYLWPRGASEVRLLSTQDLPWPGAQPWQPGWHLVGETRIDWVQPDGEIGQGEPTPPYCLLDFGRDAFAWTVTRIVQAPVGTWLMPYGGQPRRIANTARLLQWSGDGAVLYFVDQNGTDFYAAEAPAYAPHLLGQTPPVRSLHRAGSFPAMPGCG